MAAIGPNLLPNRLLIPRKYGQKRQQKLRKVFIIAPKPDQTGGINVGAGALIPHRHVLGRATDENAISIAVAQQVVTAVGEFRGVPGIGVVPDEIVIDVQVNAAARVGAGERHHA
jgi:hypothetical protein